MGEIVDKFFEQLRDESSLWMLDKPNISTLKTTTGKEIKCLLAQSRAEQKKSLKLSEIEKLHVSTLLGHFDALFNKETPHVLSKMPAGYEIQSMANIYINLTYEIGQTYKTYQSKQYMITPNTFAFSKVFCVVFYRENCIIVLRKTCCLDSVFSSLTICRKKMVRDQRNFLKIL